jgi:hypothetical protein
MSKRAPIDDPILAGANEKGVPSFTTAEFESILAKGGCGVVDRQRAATGTALGSSPQTEASYPGKSLPTQKPKPEKVNRNIFARPSTSDRCLKSKWKI